MIPPRGVSRHVPLGWLGWAAMGAMVAWSPAAAAGELVFKLDPAVAVAGQTLTLQGHFEPPGLVLRARLRVRIQGEGEYQSVDFSHVGDKPDTWAAHVAGGDVQLPALEYFVVAQPKTGKPMMVLGTNQEPLVVTVAPATGRVGANPLETTEERELRTGERAGGGTLQTTTLRRTRPQPADLKLEDASGNGTPALGDEYSVFAAEDATALAATYQQSIRTAPAIITVIGRNRLEHMGARTLLDVLKQVPGFETSKSILGFDEVSIRGVGSDPEILLLIDGHRVANPYDGRNPWAIPADIIERVEIIRGPGSALYGTGAFLGVVNVVTREQEYVRVRTGLSVLRPSPFLLNGKVSPRPTFKDTNPYNPDNDPGALGLFAPEGSAAAGFKAFGVKAYASGFARASRGQRSPVLADAFTDTGTPRSAASSQTDAREARVALTAKADIAPPFFHGGHAFAHTFFQYEDRGPYFGVFDTLGPRSQLAWLIGALDVGYAQPFGDGGEVLARLYGDGHFVDRRLQFTPDAFSTADRNGDGKPELFPQGVRARNIYLTNAAGAEVRLLLPQFFRNRVAVGLQAEANLIPYYSFTLNRDALGIPTTGLQRPAAISQDQNHAWRVNAALYLQDEWRVTDRLFTTVGVRVNGFSDVKWDPRTHITPRAALVFEPVDNLAFKALYGAAFRAPTFEEKYDQTSQAYADFSPGVFRGNKLLEPEYIQTAEAGVDYAFTLGGVKHRAATNGFYSFIGNSIDRIDQSGTQQEITNSGFRHILGAEAEVRVEFAPNAYVYGNLSWFRAWFVAPQSAMHLDWVHPQTYVSSARAFPNDPQKSDISYLTAVPQVRSNLGANVELGEVLGFHADVMLGSERRNNVRSTLEQLRSFKLPAYALLNLGWRTRPLWGWFGLEGNLYNALDYDYRDDVPRPDRVTQLLPREGLTALLGVYLQH